MKTIMGLKIGEEVFSPWDGIGKVISTHSEGVTIRFILKTRTYGALPDAFEAKNEKGMREHE